MGLIKLQDKHRFTPHGIVPLLSPRIDKEIALRLYKRSLKLDALRVQIITRAPKSLQMGDLSKILEPCRTNSLVCLAPGPYVITQGTMFLFS